MRGNQGMQTSAFGLIWSPQALLNIMQRTIVHGGAGTHMSYYHTSRVCLSFKFTIAAIPLVSTFKPHSRQKYHKSKLLVYHWWLRRFPGHKPTPDHRRPK